MSADKTISSFSAMKSDATNLVQQTVLGLLQAETQYDAKKGQQWIDGINTEVLDKLQGLSQNFKYVVSTTIIQKVGAGIHVSSTCFWEQQADGNITFRWENPTMYVIVQVFGLAL